VNREGKAIRSLHVLCVLLVAISGFAQAIHVHPENSKLPSHECSLCSVAHSGVVTSALYRPAPVFVRTMLFVVPDAVSKSSRFVSSLHIRPPPSV
jgi:hypothetical protein